MGISAGHNSDPKSNHTSREPIGSLTVFSYKTKQDGRITIPNLTIQLISPNQNLES